MLIDDVDTAKLRRTLDPEITHGIWSAIIQLSLKQHDNGSDGNGCHDDDNGRCLMT